MIFCAAWSPDGKRAFYSGETRVVASMELLAGGGHGHEQTLKGHGAAVSSVAVSTDGKLLASADLSGWIKIWDLAAKPGVAVLRPVTFRRAAR